MHLVSVVVLPSIATGIGLNYYLFRMFYIYIKQDYMNSYITLLRGINVSGKNIIKMADLRLALENSGDPISNIRTYIQTGNIFIKSDLADPAEISAIVKKVILNRFKLDVPAITLTSEDFIRRLEKNPFFKKMDDTTHFNISFLSGIPDRENIEKASSYSFPPDEMIIVSDTVYLNIPGGSARTKLTNNFLESKLKVQATTRNWRTCTIIKEMLLEG
jgi:uncharacterized protein (DUF1697 family)